jgi:hypothetical protein
VDGRDKPGHDGWAAAAIAYPPALGRFSASTVAIAEIRGFMKKASLAG